MGFITIGVSGSAHAHPAIEWGVAYAVAHDLQIELVHVVDSNLGHIDTHPSAAIAAAEARAFKATNQIAEELPGLAVRGAVLVRFPGVELLSSAKHAELLVIRSHPADSFGGGRAYSRRAVGVAGHAADALRARIKHELGWNVRVPEHGEKVALEDG
jgi:nucleotide-binding universal stress UspA family protein